MKLQNIKTNLMSIFGFMFGIMLFYIICAIWTIILCGSGIYLLKKYNKKDYVKIGNETVVQDTKLLRQLKALQILGIILICLGVLPFLDVLVRGVFFNIGANVGQVIVDETNELL